MSSGGFLLAFLGLAVAYRSTVRFYRGVDGGRVRPPPARGAPTELAWSRASLVKTLLVEWRLPILADDTAALALATFRSLTRAPELKMALFMPFILCLVLGGIYFRRPPGAPAPGGFFGAIGSTAVAGVAMLSLVPTMSNMFGLDRNGFRGIVLLPTSRTRILEAKNLAFFPFVAAINVLTLLFASWALRLPWPNIVVGVLQIPTVFFLFAPICNFFSIVLPYRLAEGSLNAQRPKAVVVLAGLVGLAVTPIVLAPTMIPAAVRWLVAAGQWNPPLPLDAFAALAVLGGAIALYRLLLPVQGRLLEHREQAILRDVTAEAE
jgi:hypothetical protein